MNNNLINKLPMPSLKNLQAFIEVAGVGSINTAAINLNITPSAVSHQIATLEEFLGKKLFTRTGKGVQLTPLGDDYLRLISGALNVIGRASDKIINELHSETLRIHSSPTFGILWLMRKLDVFRKSHPEFVINLTCSYENLQFSRDNVDIDIRHGIPDWDGYKVMTIKNEKLIPMASPEYLAKNPLKNVEDITNHNLIHSSATLANWDKWFSYNKINKRRPDYNLSFDRSYMSFEAAKMGLGVILESSMLGTELISKGKLIRVFNDDYFYPINAHHVVLPYFNEKNNKVKKLIEWMRSELEKDGFIL